MQLIAVQKKVQQQFRKIMPVGALVVVVLSSCARGPLPECDRPIAVLNQGSDLLTNIDLNDGEALARKANALETIRQELETVAVDDKKLQGFRQEFLAIYQTYRDAFDRTGEAIALVNQSPTEVTLEQVQQAKLTVEQAARSVDLAAQKAESLSGKMNRYCRIR